MSNQNTNRDAAGRFLEGTSAGPGRPPNPRKRQFTDALASRITAERWNEIVDRAVQDALNGDHRARVWLADHIMGKPANTLNLKGADAALLADLLAALAERRLSPAKIFEALLDELADEPPYVPAPDQIALPVGA